MGEYNELNLAKELRILLNELERQERTVFAWSEVRNLLQKYEL